MLKLCCENLPVSVTITGQIRNNLELNWICHLVSFSYLPGNSRHFAPYNSPGASPIICILQIKTEGQIGEEACSLLYKYGRNRYRMFCIP